MIEDCISDNCPEYDVSKRHNCRKDLEGEGCDSYSPESFHGGDDEVEEG